MMRKTACTLAISATLFCQAFAGVVVEMVSKDLRSNREAPADKIYAQGNMLRIEPHQEEGEERMSMIFRDGALLIINHKDKNYYRMDEESIAKTSSLMSEAMKQMEEQLAKLPAEQRAMMERMMKGRMQGAMSPGMGSKRPPQRIESEGSERVHGYSCEKYAIYRGEEKIQEIYAASISQVGAVAEVIDAFRAMARFSGKLIESFERGPLANMADNPLQILDEIDGFPVLTREFEKGQATSEVFFKSATEQSLREDLFSAPEGYKEVDPFAQVVKY